MMRSSRLITKVFVVVLIVVVVLVGLFLVGRQLAPQPGMLGDGLRPLSVKEIIANKGLAPFSLSIPDAIQELVLQDCGSYCGTNEIEIQNYWMGARGDMQLDTQLIGTIGYGQSAISWLPSGWGLSTTKPLNKPDTALSYTVVIEVNGQKTYEIDVSATKMANSPPDRYSRIRTEVIWDGPKRIPH